MPSHIEIFSKIYENCEWGNNKNSNYRGTSGEGSDVDYNIHTYVPFLKNFIEQYDIKSVVDLGCGDFRCGRFIYDALDVTYQGYDAYEKVVNYNKSTHPEAKYTFNHLDFYNNKESIQGGDLCILKDVIQHWTMDEIYIFMDYLTTSKKFKYILLCNCCNQTQDNPDNTGRSIPLSIKYLPLKKYAPIKLFNYNTKEVSVIVCDP
jgi:hypothetical protein